MARRLRRNQADPIQRLGVGTTLQGGALWLSTVTRRFALVRLPDGLTLSAGGWYDVGSACPEFNVPWRNVEFEDEAVRDRVLKAW